MIEQDILKAVTLLIALLILALGGFVKRIVGSWNNPGSIFCFFWFLYMFIPALAAWRSPVNPFAALYIFVFCGCLCLPGLFFRWRKVAFIERPDEQVRPMFSNRQVRSFFVATTALVIAFMILALEEQGITLSRLLDEGVVKIAAEYAGKRYNEQLVPSFYAKAAMALTYPLVAIGAGLWYFSRSARSALFILLLTFTPSLIVMLVQNAKGIIFLSIALFLGVIFAIKIYQGKRDFFSLKFFSYVIVGVAIFVPVLVISFMSRINANAEDVSAVLSSLSHFFVSYSSGHLYAFSDWFSHRYFDDALFRYEQPSFQVGFYTFMSIFQLAGDNRSVPIGIYSEFFEIPNVMQTNIYSMFRGLIIDFSLIGSLFFAVICGAGIYSCYYLIRVSPAPFIFIGLYSHFIMFAYQSYAASSFTWLSISVSIICYPLAMWFFHTKVTYAAKNELAGKV